MIPTECELYQLAKRYGCTMHKVTEISGIKVTGYVLLNEDKEIVAGGVTAMGIWLAMARL